MDVAIYARCSTKKQDLISQKAALLKWAKDNGHEALEYEDMATTGRKADRAGINRLLEDARAKKFKIIGVIELSRIGRSIGFIHKVIEELSMIDCKFCLTNSNTMLDYDTLEGRALIGGLALAADIEWVLIQERNARGRAAIKERGVKVGRKQIDVSITAITALKDQGLSLRRIGDELGVSAPTIMRVLRKHTLGGN